MNTYIQKGEQFLKGCLIGGLAHSYDVKAGQYVKPYPEVTGYVIKYLCDNYEDILFPGVLEAGRKLIEIQNKRGGYQTFYDNRFLYSFDTAQIVNGIISLYEKKKDNKLLDAIHKSGEFLLRMQRSDGAIYPVFDLRYKVKRMPVNMYEMWNGPTSGLLCKLTEAYSSLYKLTADNRYEAAIEKAKEFYLKVTPIEFTHPLGYWLEGLYAAGEKAFVEKFLFQNVINRIEENGFIAYAGGLPYSYVSGEIQLGILLAKTGFVDEAKRIRGFCRNVQSHHFLGGIFQYVDRTGALDQHVHTEINSWGTKYFCELERCLEQYG